MRIVYAPTASGEVKGIWLYNVERYGVDHANDYRSFLRGNIASLATEYAVGKAIEGHPRLRFIVVKWAQRGHGHIVVYRLDEAAQTVRILHVFHTAQDWRGRLDRER